MIEPATVLYALWFLWLGVWVLAAFWSARTIKREKPGVEIAPILIAMAGFAILFGVNFTSPDNPWQFLTPSAPWQWILAALAGLSMAFMGWARFHLGANWSGHVTLKEGHRVVDTGPYAIVRHPIYTGVIGAAFFTALFKGHAAALAGAALVGLGFWLKSRVEEKFLRAELGAAYDDYARKVPALVPFWPCA